MKKKLVTSLLAGAMSLTMVLSMMPTVSFADTATTTWAQLYKNMGVDTTSGYDAVTSATEFKSHHVKDIPSVVHKVKNDSGAITSLDGVNLTNKEEKVTPKLASASWRDNSRYGTDNFVIQLDDKVEGYTWNDYLTNLYAATISDGKTTVGTLPWIDLFGECATGGHHYNKVEISLNSGKSVGSNAANVTRFNQFYKDGVLKPGTYTVTLYSEGYKPLTATIKVVEYDYMYASVPWNEYYANEGVLEGSSTATSNSLDSHNEADLGAFDAVSRATANHGVHRGSFQTSMKIFDKEGNSYSGSHWDKDGKTLYLTDGSSIQLEKGTITKKDGSTTKMDYYLVNGLKYVPVRVEKSNTEAFKKAYTTVANGETLQGGYSEKELQSYSVTADVDKNTNGLKTVTKNVDGTFSFSAASTGKGSGLKGIGQKSVNDENITVTPKTGNEIGRYGEFIRVDLTGNAYGDLASRMQSVIWKYYGDKDPSKDRRAPVKATYGTKFAADNWMHKTNGIQLALTKSARFQLPEGSDGTGFWTITIRALGYANKTFYVNLTSDNIFKPVNPQPDKQKTTITLANKTVTYNKKTAKIGKAIVKGSTGAVRYQYYKDSACKKTISASSVKNAGTYYVKATVEEDANHLGATSKVAKLIVKKAAQKFKVATTAKTVKFKALKKKKQTTSKVAVSKAIGKITYAKVKKGSSSKLTIHAKNGKITVAKKTKKGTYKIKLIVTAKGDKNYASAKKTIIIKVKVK